MFETERETRRKKAGYIIHLLLEKFHAMQAENVLNKISITRVIEREWADKFNLKDVSTDLVLGITFPELISTQLGAPRLNTYTLSVAVSSSSTAIKHRVYEYLLG